MGCRRCSAKITQGRCTVFSPLIINSTDSGILQVLAWNASYCNPVESPYIILEYTPGVPLASRWREIRGGPVRSIMDTMFAMERALLSQPFSQYGSMYFADDVSPELRDRPLYPTGQSLVYPPDVSLVNPPSSEYLSRKYKIGPTADRQWYRGAYGSIDCDRGPCEHLYHIIFRFRLMTYLA